ncbi:MAG: hypothetical protein R2827_13995 [Bdellovibrionales bacterium]
MQWRPTVRGQHGSFYVNWSKSICNVEKDYCVLALKNPVDYPGVKVQQVADGEKIALDPNDPNKFGDVVTSAYSVEIPYHLFKEADMPYEINQQSYFKKTQTANILDYDTEAEAFLCDCSTRPKNSGASVSTLIAGDLTVMALVDFISYDGNDPRDGKPYDSIYNNTGLDAITSEVYKDVMTVVQSLESN